MIRSVLFFSFILGMIVCSCNVTGQISKKTVNDFLNDSAIRTGHVGISIYELATGKYLYNYNAEKNFIPSSNVKLFTLYAGMKYLGDSIKGIQYAENDSSIFIVPTGDPTLLHPEFPEQRVFEFLKRTNKSISIKPNMLWWLRAKPYGPGWAWDDYSEEFMAERSAMPLYGNVVSYFWKKRHFYTVPFIAQTDSTYLFTRNYKNIGRHFLVRDFGSNNTISTMDFTKDDSVKIPFVTSDRLSRQLLADTLHNYIPESITSLVELLRAKKTILYSQPVDSLFRPMMYNSDNFFAEQTLLMVSNERLGYMSDKDIIDSLLTNDFADIPTKPRWVDGSGLSRYNLFSPKDFIYILDKIKKEFGWQRVQHILPTAGQGTLKGYYDEANGDIYAKTGSMSNNVSLSGYLTTKKHKALLFSVIINNFSGSGRSGRKAIEKLLLQVRETN